MVYHGHMKVPLSAKVEAETRTRITMLAERERRTLSKMTEILIEEALIQRLLKEVRNGNND